MTTVNNDGKNIDAITEMTTLTLTLTKLTFEITKWQNDSIS